MTQYHVTVKTGDRSGAGTDSGINIKLTGSRGESPDFFLNNNKEIRGNAFERNDTDHCLLEVTEDLGDIYTIRVSNDGKYAGSDWFLDHIDVQRGDNGTPTHFPYTDWIKADTTCTIMASNGPSEIGIEEQEITIRSGHIISVPAGVDYSYDDEIEVDVGLETSKMTASDISTKESIEASAKKGPFKAAVGFALSTSNSTKSENSIEFDKKLKISQRLAIKQASTAKKYRAIYTQKQTTHQISTGDLILTIPELGSAVPAGFEEVREEA